MTDIRAYGIEPFGSVPSERQLAHFEMKKAFFHFGVNTFTGMEWGNGTEREHLFHPSECNVEQWIDVIKQAGFDMAILTAKHHDGFCLWPSAYTEHSVQYSPYRGGKGDIVREFTDACHKYGIKVGLYLSPWDRNAPFWGTDEYSAFYAKQLTELMENYGEIHEVWWDGAGSSETRYDWALWAGIIREKQPTACIFGSMGATPFVEMRWVGNERGAAGKTHYASIDAESLLIETPAELNVGKQGGDRYIPSECDVSIRPGWFYHAGQDQAVKSASRLNRLWFESVGRNSILLLNFPPDRRGLVHETDAKNAIRSHECISAMLETDLLTDATVTASTTLRDDLCAQNLIGKNDAFYAASETTAVLNITLPRPASFNVFTVSEVLEAGERVNAWRLEAMDDNQAALLGEGTSVGHLRAVRIPLREYTHLRLTVTGIVPPVLRALRAHLFIDAEEDGDEADSNNLMTRETANAEIRGKEAVLSFGGIYPFNVVSFKNRGESAYEILAFNGTRYESLCSGTAHDGVVTAHLPETVEGSYQIMIRCETGFSCSGEFDVRLKKQAVSSQ